MNKVGGTQDSSLYAPFTSNREKEKVKKGVKSDKKRKPNMFTSLLKQAENTFELSPRGAVDSSESIDQLLDSVHIEGEQLAANITPSNLERYRTSLKKLLKHIINGFEAETSLGVMSPKNFTQKKFTAVKVIDQKMESLAVYILSSQKEQVEILKKVDEIYGLLIDLIG